MQKFLLQSGLLVVEEKAFKSRVCDRLEWTERQWYYRLTEKTALTAAERIVMETILAELRTDVLNGKLDLRAYNIK